MAMPAGHIPQSLTQYTKYGNSISSTDIVKMIEEQTFEEVEMTNKSVEGVYSKASVFARLGKEDYQRLVKDKLGKEEDELKKVKSILNQKYGTLERAYSKWTDEEFIRYKKCL